MSISNFEIRYRAIDRNPQVFRGKFITVFILHLIYDRSMKIRHVFIDEVAFSDFRIQMALFHCLDA